MSIKLRRAFLVFLLFFLLVSLSYSQIGKELVIYDLLGRSVKVPQDVKKIVAIGPGALRLVTYIDQLNRVVGVENIDKSYVSGRTYNMVFHDKLEKLPIIGQGGPDTTPDFEKIISVKPDVIFVIQLVDRKGADDLQDKTKIPVIVLSYGTLGTFDEDLFKSIDLIGKVLKKESRAKSVISFIKNIQRSFTLRTKYIPFEKRPKVYVGALGFKGARGIESTQGKFPLFEPLYVRNVVDVLNKKGSVFIDKESLLVWDPDILFIDLGNFHLVKEDFFKNPNFYKSLRAYRTNNIYGILPYNNYNTNIDTALANMYWIAKVVYSEKFKDIDPVDRAKDIYTFFFGDLGRNVYKRMEEIYGGFKRITLE